MSMRDPSPLSQGVTPAGRRRVLMDISRRRIRPGAGSTPEFLRRRTASITWPDLRPVLRDIPWVVIGGVATRLYMPERATKDLDILMSRDDGPEAAARFQAAGYRLVTPLAVPGFLVRSPDGVEVDVLLGDYPWLPDALAHPRYDPAGLPVLALPYLVLMKLEVSRVQDVADVARMLGLAADETLEQVRSVVARYAPEMSEDLESLIHLGRIEMADARRDTAPPPPAPPP